MKENKESQSRHDVLVYVGGRRVTIVKMNGTPLPKASHVRVVRRDEPAVLTRAVDEKIKEVKTRRVFFSVSRKANYRKVISPLAELLVRTAVDRGVPFVWLPDLQEVAGVLWSARRRGLRRRSLLKFGHISRYEK
jgi:hypothetical protein